MNIAVRTFLCNFLDFRQFTVDSGKNNTESNIRHIVAQTRHFPHAFSKFFSSIKLQFPKTNESRLDYVCSPDTPLTTSPSLGLNPLGPKSDQQQHQQIIKSKGYKNY